MSIAIGDRLLREGYVVQDRRYGPVTILAVTEKRVWYRFDCKNRVHHTSFDQALRFFEEGTAFPPLEQNLEPRWTLW